MVIRIINLDEWHVFVKDKVILWRNLFNKQLCSNTSHENPLPDDFQSHLVNNENMVRLCVIIIIIGGKKGRT